MGRAYVLTGRTAVASSLNLASGAEVIVQDFSLGGSLGRHAATGHGVFVMRADAASRLKLPLAGALVQPQ